MARHRTTKQNRQSRNAEARRCRVVGLGTSAGAFLAFGLTPRATAPAAHADEFELIIDPIINSVAGVDLLPPLSSGVAPCAVADDLDEPWGLSARTPIRRSPHAH
jgi:hypothetical protein